MPHEPADRASLSISRLGRHARLVTVPDTEPRKTSSEALRLAGVADGDSLSASDLSCLLEEAEPKAAMNRALRLLGHRERSRGELASRLHEDGYSDRLITETLEQLVELGYLDDTRFAEAFVRAKRFAGWGRMRMKQELKSKGVGSELVEAVLDSQVPDEEETERALAALDGKDVTRPADASRALRRLLSLGFSYEVSCSAIARKRGVAEDSPKTGQS